MPSSSRMCSGRHHRSADRPGVRQPFVGGDQRRADRFRGGVVLVDDRSPPVDHLLLDLDRARRRRVHHPLEAGQVVRITHGLRQFQHAGEHRGDELAVRDAVALDRVQAAFGVELVHHHRRDAGALNRHRPHRRGGVIERGGAEVDRLGVEPEAHQRRHHARRLGGRHVRQLALDALRAAGGARRVLQQVAFDLVVDRRIRFVCNAFGVAVPAVEVVVGDDQQLRQPVRQLGAEALEGLSQSPPIRRWPWRCCCR